MVKVHGLVSVLVLGLASAASAETDGGTAASLDESAQRSIVALNVTSDFIEPDKLKKMNAAIQALLGKKSGAALVSESEIVALGEFGEDSRRVDCASNAECLAEIASKVQNDMLFGGKISRLGEISLLYLFIFDVKKSRTIARVQEEIKDLGQFEEIAERAIDQLIQQIGGAILSVPVDLSMLGDKPRIAVMDLQAAGVPKDLAGNITDVVTVELKQFSGAEVISRQDIVAMLTFEEIKAGVGCDEESCLAEIGMALGVGYLVVGNLGSVSGTYLLTLRVVDIQRAKVIGREQETYLGPAEGLLPAARFATRRLFKVPYTGSGFLRLSVREKESAVTLNGDPLGVSPDLKLPEGLPAGKHRVQAMREGYHALIRDFYIEPARQTDLRLELEELPPEWYETWWFWTITGVVAAGAAATTAYFLTTNDAPLGRGTVSFGTR